MLRIAICYDDRSDRERICGFVSEYLKGKEIRAEVKVFDHPDKLNQECETFRPQIYLLDIVMPMVTGIQAARELRCHESISVNLGAIDKLTKSDITLRSKETVPVSKSRYAEVADRYMDYRLE
ncbi:hypothetical protein BXO88_04390 [Oribacterium sp. C9]|uniref:LytTR family transcriptional regulator DNA-binding domain-containing protein n=1 Tax=Oribacterium sp. C9 TaxID=1943579 RepID=UPI00098F3F76|nr:LytTR family transcriptional regulator DNA-binding domain-containing protein [Oribacterium sp. C9]OON87508.1 hypothetical protein BXO88_04390 [Oribacterium sp. C9]